MGIGLAASTVVTAFAALVTAQGPAPGTAAPNFRLKAMSGATHSLSQYKGKTVILEWFNPDCPFVKAAHAGTLKNMAREVANAKTDVVWLAINSSAEGKQGHGKQTNEKGKARFALTHPILFDADGKVGKAYGAQRTPHMFVIDPKGVVQYRGAIDNTGGGEKEDNYVNYVADALSAIRAGKTPKVQETKAWGCSVKYAD